MRWPWNKRSGSGRLVVDLDDDHFAWLQSDAGGRLQGGGLLARDGQPAADFTRRVMALGLPASETIVVLPLAQAQLLQVEAPAVKPDEMRAAARWLIKDLVDTHLDDLTIDVMPLGDDRPRAKREVFVVAARNERVRDITQRCQALALNLGVIDIAETSQRNLQSAAAAASGLGARATALLMRHGKQALLSICAGGELFDLRRLAWDDSGLGAAAAPAPVALPADLEGLDFVDYGADAGPGVEDGAPRLVVEVQRSFDVWERSWPDLPLAALWVEAGDTTAPLVALLSQVLGLPVAALDAEALCPGFDAVIAASGHAPQDSRAMLWPLLGALRRDAGTRTL